MTYIAPSVETISELRLWPFFRRALPLLREVKQIPAGWSVHGHLVEWRDAGGWRCDCENWERYGRDQGGICKHVLAVCLRSESYRARIIKAAEEEACRSR